MDSQPRPDLVLLPGWGLPATVLAPLADALSARWRVHALALADGASLDALAAQALAQAPVRAVWVGWSLGGMVAVAAAQAAPQRVRALATIGTNLVFVAREDWPAAMAAGEFADFCAQVAADAGGAVKHFSGLVAAASRSDLRTLRAAMAAAPPPDPSLLRHTLSALRDADLRGVRLACPSLWVFGEKDALVPVAAAADIAHCLPGARTRIVAGAAHAPFLSAPAAIAADLDAFFLEFA